jgi:hypothetical protein
MHRFQCGPCRIKDTGATLFFYTPYVILHIVTIQTAYIVVIGVRISTEFSLLQKYLSHATRYIAATYKHFDKCYR